MWDPIWTVISQIALRVAVKLGADAGEEILVVFARWAIKIHVKTLPSSQRWKMGEGIIADFEEQASTVKKLKFVVLMVSAQVKLRVMHPRETIHDIRRALFGYGHPPFGNVLLLPVCK